MTKKIPIKRPRGRPPGEENQRLSLLEHAEDLFAQQGFAGTSLRQIANAASVNPALVHYYFGSKRDLLIAVLDQSLVPLADALAILAEQSDVAPAELVAVLFSASEKHPSLLPLLVREALLPGGEMHDIFAERYAPRLGGLFPELIGHGVEEGRLDPGTDTTALAVSLLALGVFPFIAHTMVERVLHLQLDEQGRARLLTQITRMLEQGVHAS